MAYKRAHYAEKGKEISDEKAEKMSAWFAEASGGDGALTLDEMKTAYAADKKKDRKS